MKLSLAPRRKVYLGDAVYAETTGEYLWLTTSDGCITTHRIALEPAVLQALLDYLGSEA